MNTLIAIHPYKAKGLWVFDNIQKLGLGKNHSYQARIRSSTVWLKTFRMPSWALPWYSQHNHFLASKLTLSGDGKSSVEIGTTPLH